MEKDDKGDPKVTGENVIAAVWNSSGKGEGFKGGPPPSSSLVS